MKLQATVNRFLSKLQAILLESGITISWDDKYIFSYTSDSNDIAHGEPDNTDETIDETPRVVNDEGQVDKGETE